MKTASCGLMNAAVVGAMVSVGWTVSVGAWVETAGRAAAATGDTKPPNLTFKSKLARMTRMNVVMATERNKVFFFITLRNLLALDPIRNSCRQNSHAGTATPIPG